MNVFLNMYVCMHDCFYSVCMYIYIIVYVCMNECIGLYDFKY